MRRHIEEIICAGNADVYRYVRKWLAFAVQHPSKMPEVALVMRGKQGTWQGCLRSWVRSTVRAALYAPDTETTSDRQLQFASADANHLTQRLVQGLVARAARRAKLDNVGVHVLRHT